MAKVRASVYWLFAPVPGREQQLVMQQWDRLKVNDSLTRRHLLAVLHPFCLRLVMPRMFCWYIIWVLKRILFPLANVNQRIKNRVCRLQNLAFAR